MKDAAIKLEQALLLAAKTGAAKLAAELNKSITRHSLVESARCRAKEAGEKVTEARVADQAVADTQYQSVCQAEVAAVLAHGEAEARAAKARCDFDIAKILAKA